jgi:hypothetical protein
MARRMELEFFVILRVVYTKESGETICNTAKVSSYGTSIASNTLETSTRAKKQAKVNSNLRDQLTRVTSSKASFMAKENITSQTAVKSTSANL